MGSGTFNPGYFGVADPYALRLDWVNVTCANPGSDGFCSGNLMFGFMGSGYPDTPFDFVVRLTGSSTDPAAFGSVTINSATTAPWSVSGGALSMDYLRFTVTPSSGDFWISGLLHIDSLASGQTISWESSSLDFTAAPEPASAAIFVAGLAWVEFLRRKSRK